jgi:hypothetical protein
MRAVAWSIVGGSAWLCATALFAIAPGQAADSPAIVIPGKAGVPVIINGVDASYAIVEGDYGLDRPGAVPLTIIPRPPYTPPPGYYYGASPVDPRGYYPADGRRHGYGRKEVIPPANRPKPPPAESYHRSWSAGSEPLPADINPPTNQQFNIEPQVDFWGRPRNRGRR